MSEIPPPYCDLKEDPMDSDPEDPLGTASFPKKLWKIVNECEFGAIGWSKDGKKLEIDYSKFQEYYLKDRLNIFKTTNMRGFRRQLNIYGFRRIVDDTKRRPVKHVFQNDYFVRYRPDLLERVTRQIQPIRSKKHKEDKSPVSAVRRPRKQCRAPGMNAVDKACGKDFTSGATGGGEHEYSGGRRQFLGFNSNGESVYSVGKGHWPAVQQGSVPSPGASVSPPAVSVPTDWPIDHTAFDTAVGSFMHETAAEDTGLSMEQLLDPNVPPSATLMYHSHDNEGVRLPSFEAFMLDSELDDPYLPPPKVFDFSFMTEDGIDLDGIDLGDEAPIAGRTEATPVQYEGPLNAKTTWWPLRRPF